MCISISSTGDAAHSEQFGGEGFKRTELFKRTEFPAVAALQHPPSHHSKDKQAPEVCFCPGS